MKMHDVGITEKEMYGSSEVSTTKEIENRIIRPSINLTLSQFSSLEGKDFGDKFTIEAEVKVKSVEKDNKKVKYGIEFLKIGIKGMDKEESPEEYIANRKKKREIKED